MTVYQVGWLVGTINELLPSLPSTVLFTPTVSCTPSERALTGTSHPPRESCFKTADEREARRLKLPPPGDLKARQAALSEKGKK